MEFVHQSYVPGETIAAIATPPGEGGVAIIRISGNDALVIASRLFTHSIFNYESHTAHFGQVKNEKGEPVDDVLLLVMYGPRSYTGENTVEIHCHGGSLITRRVLDTVLNAGARLALPGEFTFRAFINGKLDLAQAEAVQSLICAKNERALDAAENQLQGALSHSFHEFQDKLTQIAAVLEAWVDFPEEGLEFATLEQISSDIETVCSSMEKLLSSYHSGKIIHEGLSLCLIGAPNVGKSSLMNALLGKERAIVSATPGTTRDVLEDYIRLGSLHFKLSDTAGIRESTEEIELEGIRRSKKMLQEADLILCLLDATKGFSDEDKEILSLVPQEKTILVWNKIDLPHHTPLSLPFPHQVSLSAKKRIGLENLIQTIETLIWDRGPPSKEEIVITHVRHKEALSAAIISMKKVLEGLRQEVSPEFLTCDIKQALFEIGKIFGVNVTEEILSAIFQKFCIGK